jgi:hypothetical protein
MGLRRIVAREDGPVKITDRKLWERELTEHIRWNAGDLRHWLRTGSSEGTKLGMWFSAPMLSLWTVMVMVLTSAGWVVGLYLI